MNKWSNLNSRGKLLYLTCIINILFAIYFANNGSLFGVVSICTAFICALGTYSYKYRTDINTDYNI